MKNFRMKWLQIIEKIKVVLPVNKCIKKIVSDERRNESRRIKYFVITYYFYFT